MDDLGRSLSRVSNDYREPGHRTTSDSFPLTDIDFVLASKMDIVEVRRRRSELENRRDRTDGAITNAEYRELKILRTCETIEGLRQMNQKTRVAS